MGGNNLDFTSLISGPADQREEVESHRDVLVYTSKVLQQDLAIAGTIKARLYISSNCEDTNVAIRVTDVYPGGRSMLLCDGIQRLSLMKSYSQENFITPGEIYSVTIETPAVAATFLTGHRIRLIVTASNYPRFDINTNTRHQTGLPKIATNTLYHDVNHALALILPVMDK